MKKEKRHVFRKVVISLVIIFAILIGIYSRFGGFSTGKCADTIEFAKYAVPVSDITIPENTRIVALGEATHGNVEFQLLKLDVFKNIVENHGVRAFALEGDFGGCEAVNRYIHGEEGTVQEAVKAIGFAIYRTQEMMDLVSWMRTYNETAKQGEDICFYGFDMQRYAYNYQYLLEAAKEAKLDTSELEQIWDADRNQYAEAYTSQQRAEIIGKMKEEFLQIGEEQNEQAIHLADILLQNIEIGKYMEDAGEGNKHRDQMMAENVMWILKQEETRGNRCIFISGHNGHVEQFGSYGADSKVMGNLLADELGDDYFAIGTDFYKSKCNLPKGDGVKRINHTFYSHDPLAKAAKQCGLERSYLDFSQIPETSALKNQVTEYTWMGSLGEGYNALFMNLFPMSYRVWKSPAETYDAMIYVANAHPTEALEIE